MQRFVYSATFYADDVLLRLTIENRREQIQVRRVLRRQDFEVRTTGSFTLEINLESGVFIVSTFQENGQSRERNTLIGVHMGTSLGPTLFDLVLAVIESAGNSELPEN